MGDQEELEDVLDSLPTNTADDGTITYGDFELDRLIGAGGVGVIFRAHKKGDDKPVALKILSPDVAGNRGHVARFLREAKFMSALKHPNLVDAYEVGMVELSFFLSMEYVEGSDLFEALGEKRFMEPSAALKLMKQIAQGLDYGAKQGVVHRDVKPENILIAADGTAKLCDLGLALLIGKKEFHLTQPGTVVGTPAYMSPELARAERYVDHRSDIYALGCTIYHAICGRPPHLGGVNPIVVLQQHLHDTPRLPSECVPGLAPEIDRLLMKCIEKEPENRYQHYSELIEAIDDTISTCCPADKDVVPENVECTARRDSPTKRMDKLRNAVSFDDCEQ